ncbi:pyrrolidone-carboxylate peptidase [Plakobranchus ocellatus]|uniref:Pyrrolidone-carboxylate peptidase n=1 Tax=Plakobranchus ocellatus TaxID=259542 RepID=A0AAV3Y7P9_9GAST|nr:pyrrolidone-carboxylate peptidase [Plakobranchus ocellatus]
MPSGNKCIVVTGYGPFRGHKVNASWVAVQELKSLGFDDEQVELYVYEIPVSYDAVKRTIPDLWEKHKPDLMVHVGVSAIVSELTLEQQAHNDGYDRDDVDGQIPHTKMCVDGSCHNIIASDLNMSLVCEDINSIQEMKVKAVVSHDPGRYLCDFIYYLSLHINKGRTAFIHVPPLNAPYNAFELAQGLRAAIKSMLNHLPLH